MTDHDALLRAVCAFPDDDTPRLILADYYEENGEPQYAEFIRAQVELARTPEWEPFAVHCRHHKPEWSVGGPWSETLPRLDGWHVEWMVPPFRRGFGWRVRIRTLDVWQQLASELFDRVPVGELYLRAAATLDEWRRFAASPWLNRLRVVHLEGGSPVEPTRVLGQATGIRELHFHRSTSPGMSFLIEDLFRTPLGEGLRGLHFRMGYEGLADLIDALTPGHTGLERLSLAVMGLTRELLQRWCARGGPLGLTELDLRSNPLGCVGISDLSTGLAGTQLAVLGLSETGLRSFGLEYLTRCEALTSLRKLDLSRNPLAPRAARALSQAPVFSGLRSLNLAHSAFGDRHIRHLTRAKFWMNLVELDLRGNPITAEGVRHLLNARVPPNLTALLLDGGGHGTGSRTALRQRYGTAIVFGGAP